MVIRQTGKPGLTFVRPKCRPVQPWMVLRGMRPRVTCRRNQAGENSMRILWGRALPIVVASAALAIASAVAAGPASAQTVQTGTLSFTSDPGDFIGGGQSASYDISAGDTLN